MKRVLLTGAGGFVGSHTLIHFLHNTDWEIVATDSFRHKGKTDRLNEMLDNHPEYRPRVTIITHDLTAPFSPQMIDKIGLIDYIVNMASESHVDRSIAAPRAFINNNVNLMLTMLELAQEIWGLKGENKRPPVEAKFLQVSTDEVFGPAYGDYEHVEGDYHRPSNPYAASKAAQEDIGHSFWRTFNIPYMQSNTMNIIGEMQEPEKLMMKAVKCAMTGEVMPIFANKDKTAAGSRKFMHARNQADALLFILQNIQPQLYVDGAKEPSIFNVVGSKEISNLDMALLAASFTGKELNYSLVDFHSARPGHDLRYALDGTKMEKLGWKPPMTLEETVKTTVEWTLEHPEWLLE